MATVFYTCRLSGEALNTFFSENIGVETLSISSEEFDSDIAPYQEISEALRSIVGNDDYAIELNDKYFPTTNKDPDAFETFQATRGRDKDRSNQWLITTMAIFSRGNDINGRLLIVDENIGKALQKEQSEAKFVVH